jgi:hypothetical protein
MKKWQKYWLYLTLSWSSLHIVRDICQDLGIKNTISTIFVKQTGYRLPFPWRSWTTYGIAIAEIVLSLYCLKYKRFGKIGRATIFIAITTVALWSYYYFLL